MAKLEAKPIYFLYGEEPYKIREYIEKLETSVFPGVVRERLDGTAATGSDVLESLQSVGLFTASQRKLVVVNQANQMKVLDPLDEILMKTKPDVFPWGDSVLVFVSDTLDGRKKFHQWLKKQGYAMEFARAKAHELIQWANYLAKKIGVKLTPEAAQQLAAFGDGALSTLAQEIEKAWLYSGGKPDQLITDEHVSAVSVDLSSHQMTELVESILEGKKTRSLILSESLIQTPEDAIGLIGFLTWRLKNLRMKPLKLARRPQDTLARLLEADGRLKLSYGGLDSRTIVQQLVLETS